MKSYACPRCHAAVSLNNNIWNKEKNLIKCHQCGKLIDARY